eukprot:scaffold8422_cov37-Tisochrysis_lutea.AAC.1
MNGATMPTIDQKTMPPLVSMSRKKGRLRCGSLAVGGACRAARSVRGARMGEAGTSGAREKEAAPGTSSATQSAGRARKRMVGQREGRWRREGGSLSLPGER